MMAERQQRFFCLSFLFIILCLHFHESSAGVAAVIGTKLVKLGAIFGKVLSRKNIANFGDVAFSILELMPTFFDDFLGGGSSEELDEVIGALNSISNTQKKIWDDIHTLSRDVQFSIIQNSIADDAKEIESCMKSYRGYIEYQSREYEAELVNCRIQSHVRSVASILKGEKVSVKSVRLLEGVLDKDGYCDGVLFTKVYGYLFRLLFEGYNVLIFSQEIQDRKENVSSDISIYLREYRLEMKDIAANMQRDIDSCARCNSTTNYLRTAANVLDLEITSGDLHRIFPWYKFYIFKFKDNTNVQVSDFGTAIDTYKIHINEEMLQVFAIRSIDFTDSYTPTESSTTSGQDKNQYCKVLKVTYSKDKLISKHGDKIILHETSVTSSGIEKMFLEALCDVIQTDKMGLGPCQIDVVISYGNRYFVGLLMPFAVAASLVCISALSDVKYF